MTAKHTPGTWIVKPWAAHDQNGALDVCGFQVVASVGLEEVGIFSSATEDATDQEIADLHLIAAAPEMLAALRESYEALLRCEFADQGGGAVQTSMHKVLSAIARANGEAA